MAHYIEIEALPQTAERDPFTEHEAPGEEREWTKVTHAYADEIRPMSGRELANAREAYGEVNWKIKMRYQSDIIAAMRVRFNGATLPIVAALGAPHERDMILMCKGDG